MGNLFGSVENDHHREEIVSVPKGDNHNQLCKRTCFSKHILSFSTLANTKCTEMGLLCFCLFRLHCLFKNIVWECACMCVYMRAHI